MNYGDRVEVDTVRGRMHGIFIEDDGTAYLPYLVEFEAGPLGGANGSYLIDAMNRPEGIISRNKYYSFFQKHSVFPGNKYNTVPTTFLEGIEL